VRLSDTYPRLAYDDERAALDSLVRVYQLAEIREARADIGDSMLTSLRVRDAVVMTGRAGPARTSDPQPIEHAFYGAERFAEIKARGTFSDDPPGGRRS
jgi:hypothetical protein